LEAVDAEIKGAVLARHKLNKISPSFPLDHRSLANRDCLGLGVKGAVTIGGRVFYSKIALLDMLRAYLLTK
jgi:hypothetical protein